MRRTTIVASLALSCAVGASCVGPPQANTTDAEPGSASPSASTQSSAPESAPTSAPAGECVDATMAALSSQQRAAQLIMVSAEPETVDAAHDALAAGYATSVILLGKWKGQQNVLEVIQEFDALSPAASGVGMWAATDQEGGAVQKLTGDGFSDIPSALAQGSLQLTQLIADATTWAQELAAAGIDINLAPVADVVPPDIGESNAPIGAFDRQYGATAATVSPPMLAFAQGMTAGGVLPTVKHFPGIGRITGNTDESASGIEDPTMTSNDPDLQPFIDAIAADVPFVMIGSARYPQLDPANQAVFSQPIITGLLRQQLGFGGIVISDDVGAAEAVAATPVAERATRFISAGGDVVLTAGAANAEPMNAAIVEKMSGDPAFAGQVDAAVRRVLEQKDAGGLLPCS